MDPARELPYWPAAVALLIEAGQMTASDYVPMCPDLPLASEGASTDVSSISTQVSDFSTPCPSLNERLLTAITAGKRTGGFPPILSVDMA